MLDIRTQRRGGRWRVTFRGDLAIETVDEAAKELDRLAPEPVVLDLGGVTFIDSTGLTLLVRHARQNVVVGTISAEVDRIVRICGLEAELQPA